MRVFLLFLLVMSVSFLNCALAGEHPGAEHPGKTHTEEHPGEHEMLSADDIINGIKDHINSITQANAGIFPISDPVLGKDLRLKLVKVHEDKVSYIKKDDVYFACTDFVTDNGAAKYDLDFWMKDASGGKLKVYQTKIHKKDGVPRFTYKDDEIVDIGQAMAPEEHT